MRLLSVVILALTTLGPADFTHDLKEAKLKIDLPNDSWSLTDKQDNNGMTVYIFKRQPIEDSEGRQIIPNIAVIIEEVDKKLDAVTFSALKRSKVNFEVAEVYTHEGGQIGLKNAVGYKGKYVDKGGLEHTIYVVHGINDRKGLQFICDVTTNVLAQVESEFLTTLKSIRK